MFVLQRSLMSLNPVTDFTHPPATVHASVHTVYNASPTVLPAVQRGLGVSPAYFGASGQALSRAPQFAIANAPRFSPGNFASVIGADAGTVYNFLTNLSESSFVLPAQAPSTQPQGAPSDFDPQNGAANYYGIVRTSGDYGPESCWRRRAWIHAARRSSQRLRSSPRFWLSARPQIPAKSLRCRNSRTSKPWWPTASPPIAFTGATTSTSPIRVSSSVPR